MLRIGMTALLIYASSAFSADWPNIHGLNRDNTSLEVGFNWNWKAQKPKQIWSQELGSGFAGVAVADGTVFAIHRVADQEVLQALEAKSGKLVWKKSWKSRFSDPISSDDGPRCVPVVAGKRVFALGSEGELVACDAKSGEVLWQKNILSEYRPPVGYFGVGAGPIVVEDRLLVNVGAKKAGVVAFDPATGKELWKATDDPPSYSAPNVMIWNKRQLAVFFTRTGLAAIDAKTGEVLGSRYWRARLDASVNAAAPVVNGDEVFLSTSYSTGAILLKASTTNPEWEEIWSNDKSLSCHFNTPVRVGEQLYGIDGRLEGGAARLRCIDWKTGKVNWSVDRFGCANLIAVDGGLLAITEAGELIRFANNSKQFEELGRVTVLEGTVRAAPALADEVLFLRDSSKLVAISLK